MSATVTRSGQVGRLTNGPHATRLKNGPQSIRLSNGPQSMPQRSSWPRLLDGTELLGQAAGSGLREPPYLVRRCDGQVVQLSRLLYMLASRMDGRDVGAICASAAEELELRIA